MAAPTLFSKKLLYNLPMSVPVRIIHRRNAGRSPASRRLPGRFALGCALSVSLLAALAALALAFAYTSLVQDLPSLDALPALLSPPDGLLLQPTRLYDRSGQHVILSLENPAAAGRQYLPLDDKASLHLPSALITATLAMSEPDFWSSPGFSLEGLGQDVHPTLAQRLVSELLLADEAPGLRRELRERLLAAQITAEFGRRQILEWYLNNANYGRWAYGADAAARVYFGKSAADLDLAEAALLAGIADRPSFNPLDAPLVARERQLQVLGVLRGLGHIGAGQAEAAMQQELHFRAAIPLANPAPAFTALVWEQLAPFYDLNRLQRGGLQIITTLDYDLQLQSACAVATQIAHLAGEETEPLAFDGSPCQAARLLPSPAPGEQGSGGLAANAVILDPHTGQVLALVGDSTRGPDAAHLAAHPAGSLLTPFIYLAAFARGSGPATLVWDIPGQLLPPLDQVQNADGKFHGPMRLRTALANDYRLPAVQLLYQVGPENVWRSAQQLGWVSLSSPGGQGLALFEEEVTLLEAAQAFGVLDNQGILAGRLPSADGKQSERSSLAPTAILRLEDAAGHTWLDWSVPQERPVVSAQLAYLLTHVLSDEAARWPSLGHPNPLEVGRPAAAKNGQTSTGDDAWTIGYTPQWVVGVWLGKAEAFATEAGESERVPSTSAASLWHALMQYASQGQASQGWPVPPGLTTVAVCDPSGLLPTVDCPDVVDEVFISGNEPVRLDDLYRTFQVNRQSGRLATVFTPPQEVEARVYLITPPDAVAWATLAGLPIVPDSYDPVLLSASSAEVHITTPALFAYVGGQVELRGSASGGGFSYYRLQVGQGLYPQRWIQIGEDSGRPVQDGLLGKWDTSGLSGLYAVQLLVVHSDQSVEIATTQVTVDNQSPQVSLWTPRDGDVLSPGSQGDVILRAEASDDLSLVRVEFWVDGQFVASQPQAPFVIAWKGKAGHHTLTVRALDLAGNSSEATLSFTLEK